MYLKKNFDLIFEKIFHFRKVFVQFSFGKNFNKNFSFRSHFHWLNEIFVEEIEQKFGNPKSKSHRITYNLFTYLTEISSN